MANTKNFLGEISREIDDFMGTEFIYATSNVVPNRSDAGLTFGRGQIKKGKEINTCVLYVDIRNSVKLTEKHHNKTMAKIYTVFTNGVIKAAKRYNGHIRNIIGDRVMIIFKPDNCFIDSVDCAITINHIATIINNKMNVDFKCGIGVDYGKMRVLKVGVRKNGVDGIEHRGLVWTGKPANYASRLTDVANKNVELSFIEVKGVQAEFNFAPFALGSLFQFDNVNSSINTEYKNVTKKISIEEFENILSDSVNGNLKLTGFERIESYKKIVEKKEIPPILISEIVYNKYRAAAPHRNDVRDSLWKIVDYKIKNINYDVYSSSLIWQIN